MLEGEAKYRALFEAVGEGVGLVEVIFDEQGSVRDGLVLEVNKALARVTGLDDVTGRLLSDFAPNFESHWLAAYGRAARTGCSERVENYSPDGDRWLTAHFSRVGGEGSSLVAVVFDDITERKRAERALRESEERQAFLLKLSDALRAEREVQAIANSALRLLRAHLGLDRIYIASIEGSEQPVRIVAEQGRADLPPMPEQLQPRDFPEGFRRAAEGILAVDSIWEREDLTDLDRRSLDDIGLTAFIVAPLHRGAKGMIWALVAGATDPRQWTTEEAQLLAEAAERVWQALERTRTEIELRESEEQYRTLFESLDEAVATLELSFDENGKVADVLVLDANPVTEQVAGIKNLGGKRFSEVVPGLEQEWFDIYDRVIKSGEAERSELYAADIPRWVDVRFSRVGGDGSRKLVAVFNDITARKQAEAALRESEERQAFLLELSDALRPLADPVEIMEVASAALGRHLGLGRCGYGEVDPSGEYFITERDWTDGSMPSAAGTHRVDDFGGELLNAYRAGQPLIINDACEFVQDAEQLAAFEEAGGFRANVCIPLMKRGRWVAALYLQQTSPRRWTDSEIALTVEVAERTWAAVERARSEAALRESEERFAQFANASSAGLWIRDAKTLAMEFVSPAIGPIYGVEIDAILGDMQNWAAMIVPEDREAALEHVAQARKGEPVVHEFRIQRASDGAFRWIRNTDFPLGGHGQPERVGGIAEDVTDEKLAAEHQSVLLLELQHRVRNIMAIIRSIVARTQESAGSVGDYAELLSGRLLALARVQALLTRAANAKVGLAALVHDELTALAAHARQFDVAGPDVELSPKAAETMTLAIHELATNALKYGALSRRGGVVTVRWEVTERRGTPWLAFRWTEAGAPPPPPSAGPRRVGFGSEMIEGRIPYELRGSGKVTIEPGGARCELEFPLAEGGSVLETDAPTLAAVFGGAIDMSGQPDLSGHRVLVLEDDYYIATDTTRALRGAGAQVIGPCANEDDARDAIAETVPTCAVVDINLGTGPGFAFARELRRDGVPFVFITGYDQEVIPDDFAEVKRLEKPVQFKDIIGALAETICRAP